MENINQQQSLTTSQLLLFTNDYNRRKLSLGIAIWLCLLLGIFGAHRFYLKKNISGVFYLLFSWSLIPGFLAIADLFLLRYQIISYNNLLAVEILSHVNPNSAPELPQFLQKNIPQWPRRIGQALAILAAIIFGGEIYLGINNELSPLDIIHKLMTQPFIFLLHRPQNNNDRWLTLPYYNITYDGLKLGTSLVVAQKLGYTECNQNNYFTICSNPKNDYPQFLGYKVQFAIAEFTDQNELIALNLYLESEPSYHNIVTTLASQSYGNKNHIDYLSVAGSHENISIDTQESSIRITNRVTLLEYNKYIHRQKLLNINESTKQ